MGDRRNKGDYNKFPGDVGHNLRHCGPSRHTHTHTPAPPTPCSALLCSALAFTCYWNTTLKKKEKEKRELLTEAPAADCRLSRIGAPAVVQVVV